MTGGEGIRKVRQEEDEEEDLFGQDEEDDLKSKETLFEKEMDGTGDDEDLFGQDDDDNAKEENIFDDEKDCSGGETPIIKEESKSPSVLGSHSHLESGQMGFELDMSPSDVPVSSPVPRKATKSSPPLISSPPIVPVSPSGTEPPQNGKSKKAPPASSATKLGLRSDVVIPHSVNLSLLSGRILETLKMLPSNLSNDALQEYDDAIQQRKNVRNHGAYLFGVLKRYLSVHQRAGCSMGQELTPEVQRRLDQLVSNGFCTQDEMNEKVKSKIRMLSETDAIFAIEEFSGVDRPNIRNVGSYFMGILNRYMRGERSSKNRPEARGRDDRSHDHGRPRDRESRREKGYGQDRDSHRRERSRDDPHRNHNDRSNYAPRPQSHYGHQQPAPPPPPPPPPRPPYGQQQPPNAYQQPQSFVSNPHSQPQQNFVTNQGFPQHNIPGSSQRQLIGQPFNHQPPHMAQSQMSGNPHVSSMPAPGMMVPNNPVGMSDAQNYGMFDRSGVQLQNHNSQQWQQQQPARQGGQADILGIAAKAAQALATSQSRLHGNQQGMQQGSMPGMQQGSMPGMQQGSMPGMQQGSLPGMQQGSMPGMQQGLVAQAYIPQGFNPIIPQGHPQQQQRVEPQRRGRTVAKMHELPISVQFAVQNLQAVGHIAGPLDEGILGMVKDLPEPLALEAINRFSALDKSSMRNTTAYFAGLLRRELEKIQRR